MNGVEGNNNSFITKLRLIVLDNLKNEQFSVERLAAEYGLSRSQLHKKLKKSIGKSVSQFIREVRLDEGLKLLLEHDRTVSQVAYEVGFSSPTYFNTCFKAYFGYSPGEAKIRNKMDVLEVTMQTEALGSSHSRWPKWLFYALGSILAIGLFYGFILFRKGVVQNQQAEKTMFVKSIEGSQKRSIAVLPLKNWSGDEKLEYICDGMTDAIINKLNKIQAIDKVVPYTSVARYKSADKSIKEIAQELDVNNILQGSFQLAGNTISIRLQMIDGESEQQFWNNEYTEIWVSDELFKLQARVAENISETIGAEITEPEVNELNTVLTSNKQAYDLYLQANYEWSKGTRLGFDNAKRLFGEAIEIDSTFVDAYVDLSHVWSLGAGIWGNYDPVDAKKKAEEYIRKAKRIAPNNEKVTDLFLRMALLGDRNFAVLEKNYHKTLLAPLYLMYVGKYEEAEEYMQNAKDLKNTSGPLYSQWCAESFFYNDKGEKALEIYKKDYAVYSEHYNWMRESIKYLYYLGEYKMARERLNKLMQIFSDRPPIVIWLDAVINEALGEDPQKVQEQLDLLNELEKKSASGSPAWFIALYHCHIGDYDTAFRWLEEAYIDEGEIIWLHSEPLLKPVRQDERYIELHKKIGFPLTHLN